MASRSTRRRVLYTATVLTVSGLVIAAGLVAREPLLWAPGIGAVVGWVLGLCAAERD